MSRQWRFGATGRKRRTGSLPHAGLSAAGAFKDDHLFKEKLVTMTDQFPRPIEFTITGTIETDDSIGGWSIVPLPGVAAELGTRKAVKVGGTVDGVPFEATILPWGDGTQMVPIKAPLRKKLGKAAGDEVTIHLVERFS